MGKQAQIHACVTRAMYAAEVVNFTIRAIYLRVKSAQFSHPRGQVSAGKGISRAWRRGIYIFVEDRIAVTQL